MMPEATYKFIEENKNNSAVVYDKDGGRITSIHANSPDELIAKLREWEPAFASYRKIKIMGAKGGLNNCSVQNGNVYDVEFPYTAVTPYTPVAKAPAQPDMNTTMFNMMMAMMNKNSELTNQLVGQVNDGKIALIKQEMDYLKKEKSKKSEIDEFADAAVKMEPMLARWFGRGGNIPAVQNAPMRGPGNGWATQKAPTQKLTFEEMAAKPEPEQVNIFMEEFKVLQDKLSPVQATKLLTLANSNPEKINKLVDALLAHPEHLDTAVSLLSK